MNSPKLGNFNELLLVTCSYLTPYLPLLRHTWCYFVYASVRQSEACTVYNFGAHSLLLS